MSTHLVFASERTKRRILRACIMAVAMLPEAASAQDGLFGGRGRFTETNGAAIYRYVCAGCHMPDGRGAAGAGRYPALAQDPRLEDPAYPIDLVLHGRGAMPPFQRYLSDEQVAAVVGYIRQGFGNEYPDPPTADQVRTAREQR